MKPKVQIIHCKISANYQLLQKQL